jgi:hypothetical protein
MDPNKHYITLTRLAAHSHFFPQLGSLTVGPSHVMPQEYPCNINGKSPNRSWWWARKNNPVRSRRRASISMKQAPVVQRNGVAAAVGINHGKTLPVLLSSGTCNCPPKNGFYECLQINCTSSAGVLLWYAACALLLLILQFRWKFQCNHCISPTKNIAPVRKLS